MSEEIETKGKLETHPVSQLVVKQLKETGIGFEAVDALAMLYAAGGDCPLKDIPALMEAFTVHQRERESIALKNALELLRLQAQEGEEKLFAYRKKLREFHLELDSRHKRGLDVGQEFYNWLGRHNSLLGRMQSTLGLTSEEISQEADSATESLGIR